MEFFGLALLIHMVINLWLIVVAFTRSVVWGILVLLFSPLAAVAFGIGYFRDVKLPFLLYLASGVLLVGSFFMIEQREWQQLCARADENLCQQLGIAPSSPEPDLGIVPPGVAAVPPAADAAPTTPPAVAPATGTTPAPAVGDKPAEPAASTPPATTKPADKKADPLENFPKKHSQVPVDPLQVKKQPPPVETEKVNPANVGRYLNRYLIVTMNNKVEHRGLLKKVDNTTLYLERKWEATMGEVMLPVNRSRIKSIVALKKPPKE